MEMRDLAFHLPCSTLSVILGAVEALLPQPATRQFPEWYSHDNFLAVGQSEWPLNPLHPWLPAGLRPLKQPTALVTAGLTQTWRCCVAEVWWLGLQSCVSSTQERSWMSSSGKRDSCEDSPANINKRNFLECVVAPVLRCVKTVPIR